MRLVSVDLHTFGADALTAVRLIEHQATADQAAEVRPQLVEQVPAAVQGAAVPGECLSVTRWGFHVSTLNFGYTVENKHSFGFFSLWSTGNLKCAYVLYLC